MIIIFIFGTTLMYAQENNYCQKTTDTLNRDEAAAYPINGRLRFSFQKVDVTNSEEISIYSFHYDIFNVWRLFPDFFMSIGGYGALSGHRGGFFVGGYGAGYDLRIMRFFDIEAGIFFGGGGGGGAPQGSGLMLQQYIAFQIRVLGMGFHVIGSNINFPDGAIGSRQIAAGCAIPVESWIGLPAAGKSKNYISNFYARHQLRIFISPQMYFPVSDSRKIDNTPLSNSIALIGIGLEYYFTPEWFAALNLHGAFYGNVDGYAQMLAGIGRTLFSTKYFEMAAIMQAGAGGGGAVHTGGGGLIKPSAGIRALLGKNMGLFMNAGYTYAPGGYFKALSLEAGLMRDFSPLTFEASDAGKLIPDYVPLDYWKIVMLNKTFFPAKHSTLKNGTQMENIIQLVGFALYHPITGHLSWTGQGFGAWDGGIGGYAEGLVGFEVNVIPFRGCQRLELSARVSGGAAGGGGTDPGSGLIWESAAGFSYKLSDKNSIILDFGFLDAVKGSLQGIVLRVGVSSGFSIPMASE